jgi:SWI/SNF-related matrix-associated actin-dependent regulator 1 of chromatin subfamily A
VHLAHTRDTYHQVLKDLPNKTESKVSCPMETSQEALYNSILERSRDVLVTQTEEELEQAALDDDDEDGKQKTKTKAKTNQAKQKASASSNILMDLRKAALHPLLFRRLYDDKVIRKMARDCMKEEEFMTSEYDLIVEDMEVRRETRIRSKPQANLPSFPGLST